MTELDLTKITGAQKLQIEVFWAPPSLQQGFRGLALAVSAKNSIGAFDILPGHENFMSEVGGEIVIHTLEGQKISFNFSRGVAEVSENQVKIYLAV